MKKMDAVGPDGKISRFRAVFNALDAALESLTGLDDVSCSLVLFSDAHDVRLRHRAIGSDVRFELARVRESLRGVFTAGTSYLEALRGMQSLATGSIDVGVLFSDGEPTDPDPNAAVGLVRELRQRSAQKFLLHTVGFGDFDTATLRSLADLGGGLFHGDAALDVVALRRIFLKLTQTVTTLRSTVLTFGVQALRPLPPREKEAEDFWRKASPEELSEASEERLAWLMLRSKGSESAEELVACGEARKGRLHRRPFAEGALRYAFHFFTLTAAERSLHLVVKESKFGGAHGSPQQAHHAFLVNHRRAEALAAEFNGALSQRLARSSASVKFVPAFVIKLSDESMESGFRYAIAEKFIEGSYEKMNGNDGYVNGRVDRETAGVAAAFSHFSFEHTAGRELCVDIQGVGREWTDPQLHSRVKAYGAADLGEVGMRRFFKSHSCSELCQAMRLQQVHPESLELELGDALPF